VEDSRTFYEFHHIIQIVMGWSNYHLYQFNKADQCIADPSFIEYRKVLDSKKIKLNKIFNEEGQKIDYEYDFGDGWMHTIKLEKILPIQLNKTYPVCIRGKRSCPPEDCGGIWGYENLKDIMSDKKHPEYKEMKRWLGGVFDPEEFNLEDVNTELMDLENYISGSMFEL
jgi:hypothetical protein